MEKIVPNPEGWVDFWLETNQYFSIVRYGDLPVLREAYPDLSVLMETKMLMNMSEDPIRSFGFRVEYNGQTLGNWLATNNMLQYFNN